MILICGACMRFSSLNWGPSRPTKDLKERRNREFEIPIYQHNIKGKKKTLCPFHFTVIFSTIINEVPMFQMKQWRYLRLQVESRIISCSEFALLDPWPWLIIIYLKLLKITGLFTNYNTQSWLDRHLATSGEIERPLLFLKDKYKLQKMILKTFTSAYQTTTTF